MNLANLVIESAAENPDAMAVKAPDGTLRYGELDAIANQLARALKEQGVRKGDRVGIWLSKSAKAIVAMQGILRLGAAYVPIDPLSPPMRVKTILQDCSVTLLVTDHSRAVSILSGELNGIKCLTVDEPFNGPTWSDLVKFSGEAVPLTVEPHDLAYILYTSGSTGTPKGVCISHENALAFIEWAAVEVAATAADRFSNHAPFHFDLSVFDLYVAFLSGASVVIVPEGTSYMPEGLVRFLQEEKLTVWYSVPSALILMMEQGGLLHTPPIPLRVVVFAGEAFPTKHLQRLRHHWPEKRFLNFYGPTETNVCTYYEVKSDFNFVDPIPIGSQCSGDRVWAVKRDGNPTTIGEEGELMVSGPTVMLGYWGKPPQNGQPYATGDIVRLLNDGNYFYIGRRDHMVKVRGYRVELGEVEAALLTHPQIHEAAVLVGGTETDAKMIAFLVCTTEERPSLLEMKQYCSDRLPRYMVIDRIRWLSKLPRTGNGKIDRTRLANEVSQ